MIKCIKSVQVSYSRHVRVKLNDFQSYYFLLFMYCADGLNDENIEAHRASITTELHFLYTADTTNIEELFSPDPKHQMGLGILFMPQNILSSFYS